MPYVEEEPRAYDRRTVYTCALAEILTNLGTSICVVPVTRLIEGAICQRFYASDIAVAENLCKTDGIQEDMAHLLGAMSSFGFLPGLVLTIPYGILAEHFDRRILLLVNTISNTTSMLYIVAICYFPGINLKLLWLAGLFDIVGGGSPFFFTLLRTMVAEAVPNAEMSALYYKLSGINLLVHLFGVVVGSWLLQDGAPSTMLVGICIYCLVIPLLTYLPTTNPQIKKAHFSHIPMDTISPKAPQTHTQRSDKAPLPSPPPSSNLTLGSELLNSIRGLKNLLLTSSMFGACLFIMYLNTTAMGVRMLLRPWTSRRYDWTLAQTGYVFSAESLLSAVILFVLPFVKNPMPFRKQRNETDEPYNREIRVATTSLIFGIVGAILLALSRTRVLFFLSLVVFSGNIGFLDAMKAYFTTQLETNDIGRLYTCITAVEMLAMIVGAPVWGVVFSKGYEVGGFWEGVPFLCTAVLLGGTLVMVRKAGGSVRSRAYVKITQDIGG